MNFIKRFFTSKKTLQKELDKTLSMLDECQNKVLEKQEVINKTNAYYKKKMHEMKAKKSKKTDL